MYSHKDTQKNSLKRLTVNIDQPAQQKLDEIKHRTRFSRGEIISKVITNQPLPKHVLESDSQYLELMDQLTKINQSLGTLGDNSDQTAQLILEGLRDGNVPDDKKYRDIVQRLRAIRPQLDEIDQTFQELQRANLFFLYGHRT